KRTTPSFLATVVMGAVPRKGKGTMFSSRSTVFRIGLILAAIAAVWTVVHIILGIASFTGDDFWGYALLVLFVLALILAFVEYAQERPALLGHGTAERFPEPTISRFFLGSEGS